MSGWQIIFVACSDLSIFPGKLLYPATSQPFNGWERARHRRSLIAPQLGQQLPTIFPDLLHHFFLLVFGPGNAPFFDPTAVALKPRLRNPTAQPLGMVLGQRIEGRA